MYKAKDLRDHHLQELEAMLQKARKNLFQLVNQFRAEKKRENPHEIRHARKDIARLETIITEKRTAECQR